MISTQHIDLGRASVRPKGAVTAGSLVTVTFSYTAGHPVDDTGYVKIAFRHVSDFGVPQFEDPSAPNYCTVRTTGNCRIEPRWDPKGHTRPWCSALYLKVISGYLDQGEKIEVIFGDTSGGSPGWQIQTFCERSFEFKTFVDPIATYEFKELPVSPTIRIAPGPPARAVCIAPSQVTVNRRFSYHIKLEDDWGNPTAKPIELTHRGFSSPGIRTIAASDKKTHLRAVSNPVDVSATDARLHPYWADLHGQSEETIGTNTIEDYFTFARDFGLVDIAGHQGNDFQITDAFWAEINRTTRRFYVPGSFVTFPGYEWSANTPLGGDRNVYFTSEGGEILHSCADLLPGKKTKHGISATAARLFQELKKQHAPEAFAFAHVGGRYADMAMHDPVVEQAVEIHSAWGTFEWLVEDALARGYRVGICANSDGHKCRPGASYPGTSRFGSLGGLTCVLARKLDRKHVVQAVRDRHFYATTGNRPVIELRLLTGDGREAMMGDVISRGSGTTTLQVRIAGTAPIESVEIRNDMETIGTLRPYGRNELGKRIKILWSGAEARGRARMVPWDGRLRLRGNGFRQVIPINFWNPSRQPRKNGKSRLEWE